VSRFASQARKHILPGSHRGRWPLRLSVAAAMLPGAVAFAPAPATGGEAAATSLAPAPAEGASEPAAARPQVQQPAPAPAGQNPSLAFRNFVDQDFVRARQSGSPVVLYFEADWCEPCKEMHARTFREPSVVEAAAGMELFRFDMTSPDGYVDIMKNSFRVIGAPTVIVFAPGGKEVARRFGFIPPADFTEMLGKGRRPPAGS
jgi:thiol:disulfide interchange protein